MRKISLLIFVISLFTYCKRYEVNEYELNNVYISQGANQKKNRKSDDQFISLMYKDIYETSIPYSQLKNLQRLQESFGDKNVTIERIAQNMLIDIQAQIPSDSIMTSNPDEFITDTYQRFLTRTPNESEVWYLKSIIENNTELTVKEVYYAFITSEEYKHY